MKQPGAKNKVSFQIVPPHQLVSKKHGFFLPNFQTHVCVIFTADVNYLSPYSFLLFNDSFDAPLLFHLESQRFLLSLIVRKQSKEGKECIYLRRQN